MCPDTCFASQVAFVPCLRLESSQSGVEIEAAIRTGEPNTHAIMVAIIGRVLCLLAEACVESMTLTFLPQLKQRVESHFSTMLFRARLQPEEEVDTSSHSGQEAWISFESMVDFIFGASTTTFSNIVLVAYTSRATKSNMFLFLCIARPLSEFLLDSSSVWDLPHLTYVTNTDYKRASALLSMTDYSHRSEVSSAGIVSYLVDEYQKAVSRLGSLSDDHPMYQFYTQHQPMRDLATALLGDAPMLYCSYLAVTHPTKLSLTQFTLWERASSSLRTVVTDLMSAASSFQDNCQTVNELYEAITINTGTADTGQIAYPQSEEQKSQGMSFEFRDLSFSYPGSQTREPALRNISLCINPGQIVVIVGANGSGKSTLIKLLHRAHEPTSGAQSLLVDGLPISAYRVDDLKRSMALLSQAHTLLPISLGENIGMGYVDNVSNVDAITRAAELGGATQCIEKLKDGLATIRDPMLRTRASNMPSESDHPLNIEFANLPKHVELSGGEEQRIVASRTLMRIQSGTVKLVAVDEPSSALDPEGEMQLFENLIKLRTGKTLIFVTHRFGHLTKYADLILCMKDGRLVESGSHKELLKLEGEYAKLYDIQASAFVDE